MPDLWLDVDINLSEVPVNIMPLVDDTDFKTKEEAVVFNQAGLDLIWNFITTGGAFTQTAVTPTDTAGDYDWLNQGNGFYTIEIPASGGASINNDTEGFGWFSGFATGILPWRGPIIGFRSAALNNALIDGGDLLDVNVTHLADTIQTANDIGQDVNDILIDTNELQADWTNGGRLDLLIDAIKAVTDLLTAADSEPAGVPAANETPLVKLAYIFMALRNRVDVTATDKTFYDDAGTAEWKKALSDDATTYSEAEAATP